MWQLLFLLSVCAADSFAEDNIEYQFKSSPYKTLSVDEHSKAQQKVKQFHENWRLQKIVHDDNYEYIFEWNCFCATCLEIPKYVRVTDDKIVAIKFSDKLEYDYYPNEHEISPQTQRQFTLALPNYGCDDLYLHSKHYHTMEGLFHILQQSLHPSHYDPNRHIISMTFDTTLNYPKAVYISNDLHELGWNIKCLSMGGGADGGDDTTCSNSKAGDVPFWIEQRWQELIGWLMLALVFCMSCIAHFIEYLKKRARKKHRARLNDQMQSQNQVLREAQPHHANNALSARKKHGVVRKRKAGPKARGRKRERDAGDMKVEEEEEQKHDG